MTTGGGDEGWADQQWPDASSLLSSRWSRDNLVTFHPAQLYDGAVERRMDLDALSPLVGELAARIGPFELGTAHMGVFTWDLACLGPDGPFTLQIPAALDQPGAGGRARRRVPRMNFENMQRFAASGLARFVLQPYHLFTLAGDVPAATFRALPDHHVLKFGRGGLHVERVEGERSWLIPLGPATTAELLAQMVAALVYHYDPDDAGGTALTDVFINDGDFVVRRLTDGAFDLRLTAARRREPDISPNLLLLYLIQLMAYEDWEVNGGLVGLPVLVSNPSVAFEGMVRGRRDRWRDTGRSPEAGAREAMRWIGDFGRSREGRAYRPWTERFLAGQLPLAFGDDLRERWWRLMPLRTKLGLLELRARQDSASPTSPAAAEARTLASLIESLASHIGHPDRHAGMNDLGPDDLVALLSEAGLPPETRGRVAGELLAGWPYRSLDDLLARVPGARLLRPIGPRLSFGRALSDDEQGTLLGLGALPATPTARPLANREVFGGPTFPAALHEAAVRSFPTFEAYMDAALHDPRWGYYTRRVAIGRGGDFITNPESLSPRYGGWIAALAFRCWQQMLARGLIAEGDEFPIVEFGAGTGRLARDLLDAVAAGGDDAWRRFAARVSYRVYETSAGLRQRQQELLGGRARIADGDARHPAETLNRDFPGGVRGLILTNEVPDAFGVHKVVMTTDGQVRAALVVPRVEGPLLEALPGELARRIEDTDRALRRRFALTGHASDRVLDQDTFGATMAALTELPAERAEPLRGQIWFEESYVPAAAIPALAAHLAEHGGAYAEALQAEGSGVVQYVNVHAGRFIRELGSSLAAGFVLTTDYGDTTWNLVQGARRGELPFRVYGPDEPFVPRPNDPYSHPGTQDLTADVNFTEIVRAATDAGFELLHYGPERDLVGADLPDLVRLAANEPGIAEFLGNPVFKALLLGKKTSTVMDGPLASALPLKQVAKRHI
ncbi:MAG TPA: SAM-dependent methyltransferase [Polyangia bacterium]|nr:SAM-dependent methyltransferase [Polyangia bacterium]